MLKSCWVPLHVSPAVVNCGVTLSDAVTGLLVLFNAVNALMSPVPLAANPIEVVLFVHEYDDPVPLKATAAVEAPLQTT